MPSKFIKQADLEVSLVEASGLENPLPCAFYESRPTFKWTVPAGFTQFSYDFEMRTMYPVLYSDGMTYRCAYYNSGVVVSPYPTHRLTFSMNSQTIAGQTSTVSTWLGVCEVRIRLFDKDGNEYTTHERVTDGTMYDFEVETVYDGNGDVIGQTPKPQLRRWGSRNDGYYFCYDESIDKFLNSERTAFEFRKSQDEDAGQNLRYEFQISDTPLFGDGLKDDAVLLDIPGIVIPDSDTTSSLNATFVDSSRSRSSRNSCCTKYF